MFVVVQLGMPKKLKQCAKVIKIKPFIEAQKVNAR